MCFSHISRKVPSHMYTEKKKIKSGEKLDKQNTLGPRVAQLTVNSLQHLIHQKKSENSLVDKFRQVDMYVIHIYLSKNWPSFDNFGTMCLVLKTHRAKVIKAGLILRHWATSSVDPMTLAQQHNPRKHDTLKQWCFNAGPTSATLVQH